MQTNRGKVNLNENFRNDHQRQQERLKTMSAAPDKVKTLSAELMIENLFKESFKNSNPASVPSEKTDNFYSGLPFWLQCESTAVPSLYKQLWSLVALTAEQADTQKVSQLLLTSGLHVDVLGFIWSLANKVIPGQLTKQEFYIVLALVGLAQTGCTFNSLNVLTHIPGPCIPILQSALLTNTMFKTSTPKSTDIPSFQSFQQIPNVPVQQSEAIKNTRDYLHIGSECNEKQMNENVIFHLVSGSRNSIDGDSSRSIITINQQEGHINKELSKKSLFPCIGSSPTLELEDDFSEFQSVPAKMNEVVENLISSDPDVMSDDFTDFQSANLESLDPLKTVIVPQTREIPRILSPKSFSEQLATLKANIKKMSPESEKRLKVLSATESLSSLPESKISSANTVSTSISVLGGSIQTNHSFNDEPGGERCYKHQKLKAVPGPSLNVEEVIFGVKPMYVEKIMPKYSNISNSFLLKESKILNDDISKSSCNDENSSSVLNFSDNSSKESTRQIKIPMFGTFNETVLPSQKKTTGSFDDLISVQEDKYSALREINLVLNQETNDLDEKNDEFGDFLSANIPPLASTKTSSSSNSVSSPFFENVQDKNWGVQNFNKGSKAEFQISDLENFVLENESKPESHVKEEEQDLFDAFTTLSIIEKSRCLKEMTVVKSSELQDIFPATEIVKQSKDGNKDNVVLFGDQSKNNLGLQLKSDQTNSQSNTNFWIFLNSEVKPTTEVTLSRQGSVHSLDLKISAVDETEQEVVWRKCLESCHYLIHEGFQKFNNIRIKSVLDEVFSSSKTKQYLNCLHIVYQISKRVSQNFNDQPSLQEDLERLWARLQELCFEYNITLMSHEEEVSEGASQCCICLKYVVCNLINQGMYSYHPSCANLWINFIEETLPFST